MLRFRSISLIYTHTFSCVTLTTSCGLPCEHVLKITNELRHEMIHVQNWKIFASNYNDYSTDLGFELKKAQLHFKQYGEQMGVLITDEMGCMQNNG
jgi:hypothetical protein